ncbi:tetratricopeptide repeat protein [Streptomyces sp. NPDC050485]|uniref:tetratricopeptide repeat protein n=1 Tax=Streptomyces sp. NPDC050485 TaxID=3365617 RepID=UPI0037BB5552
MTALHPTLERAHALIEFGRHDQALALLGRHLAEDPGDIRAWVKLSYCHLHADEPEKAMEAADEALRLAPEDYGALLLRAQAMVRNGGWLDVEPVLREAVRVAPEESYARAMLADAVWRVSLVRYARETGGGGKISFSDTERVTREAADLAMEALRLGPEDIYAHEIAQRIASTSGNSTVSDQLDEAILRIDPTHSAALARQTEKAAQAPGVGAGRAAELYADALAGQPDHPFMQQQLDRATYRLLRGTRWLALLCLVLAGGMINLFPSDDQPAPELPLPIGQRLWSMVIMAVIWGFGAWRRYRKLRAGVQLNVRSLIRRGRWARVVLAQSGWAMLCAVLIAGPPWTDLPVPRLLFWAGIVPIAATILFDKKKAR